MGEKIGQLLLIIIFFIKVWFSAAQNDDLSVMNTLKDEWDNTPPSWEGSSDPCSGWEGIRCTNGRVTSITLASMNLEVGLTADIAHLTELQILDLSYNKGLTGSLTPAIGNLKKLTHLILVGCSFNGPLPDSLGNLDSLNYIPVDDGYRRVVMAGGCYWLAVWWWWLPMSDTVTFIFLIYDDDN